MSDIGDTVKKLLEHRPADLLELVEGDSEYFLEETAYLPRNTDESYLVGMACEHIRFVSEFGLSVNKSEKDGKYYSSYPDYFDQWVSSGCLALSRKALSRYLEAHPLR